MRNKVFFDSALLAMLACVTLAAAKVQAAPVPATTTQAAAQPAAKSAGLVAPADASADDKAAAAKYVEGCAANYRVSGTYDCQCMGRNYLISAGELRAEHLDRWNNGAEARALDNIARAKQKGDANLVARAQWQYDKAKASVNGTPEHTSVQLRMEKRGPACYDRSAIVKMETTDCMQRSGQKTMMGTPIDAAYCGCVANEIASGMIDRDTRGTRVKSNALLACDAASPLHKTGLGQKK